MARWQCAGNNVEMEVASGGQTMSVLRRGRGRCVGLFPVLLVPWQFFRLVDAVRCTGHRSALHRLLRRAALGFAARCVRHTSPHAIVTGALPVGNLPLSCILFIRSFCSFLPYLPFPHPLPTSSSAAHPDTLCSLSLSLQPYQRVQPYPVLMRQNRAGLSVWM